MPKAAAFVLAEEGNVGVSEVKACFRRAQLVKNPEAGRSNPAVLCL